MVKDRPKGHRAFDILAAEVKRLCGSEPLQKVRQDIVLKRLQRFRLLEGPPLTLAEMRDAVEDIFPDFSEAVLKRAAKANGAAVVQRQLGFVGATALGLVGLTGAVWLLNLPYPMIRWPVARVAPMVLLPSFIRMDRDYRQTVSLVAQADQLVNRATSAQDIELGSEKVTLAQKHLDGLPVWFLGYYPQTYCTWVSCTWRFTFDEFQTARSEVGRMEARVFQEKNSQDLLQTATAEVETAKQTYRTAQESAAKTAALVAWQSGMDRLNEIPAETLAGRMAQIKLAAYTRDYQEVAGSTAGGNRSNTLIGAAQEFARTAAQEGQNPPHNVETWRRIVGLWQQAINRLEQVPVTDVGYAQAQSLLATYMNNRGIVEGRMAAEEASVRAMEDAKAGNQRLLAQDLERMAANQIASQLQGIVNDLSQVQKGTTVYAEAQEMLRSAEEKLKQLNP
jgi:hypothetical protein